MIRFVAFILCLLFPIVSVAEAHTDNAIPTPQIFQNPFMAPNNFSEIHFNSFQTDTTSVSGPASASSQIVQQGLLRPIPGIGASIAFNSSGQILTVRVGPSHTVARENFITLLLIDPVTLKVLDHVDLPPKSRSGGPVSFSGGGYFYEDNQDRAVTITANNQIRIYGVQNNQFESPITYDVSAKISGTLVSVLPDNAGNLWFTSDEGNVGYVNPTSGTINVVDLNETISKSFATDEDGGVYVVSNYALYRFEIGPGGTPQHTWRSTYNRGRREKPGQNQQGSGTTPTLFNDFAGRQFVAIADNADPFMHVNVYNRQTGALVAHQKVFTAFPLRNACENSLMAVDHSIIIENNYGNRTIASTLGARTTVPGIDRVDFDPRTGQSQVAWENDAVAIPSVVTQLSTGDGLVYTYAKDTKGWYFAALDFRDGSLIAKSRVPLSNALGGVLANNFYSGISIGPDGSAYVGVFGGFLAWRPE
ncbi:MAG: hypothetical protein JO189_13025 [Deltaproteobacteria bacterium]|nr:hypothetical protein [Deltaproteobacteria bacterium]